MYDICEKQGFTFWPVGTGDSTTITIDPETIVQVDLYQLGKSEDDDDPRVPVVDELIASLPRVGSDKSPYLAVFVLTHPDKDHCLGFGKLLEEVIIGEIWFSPRIFSEYEEDLCYDANLFAGEAIRRVEVAKVEANLESGDRIRVIGYSELLKEEEYRDLPQELLTVPGSSISILDGKDVCSSFAAFIHGPFKDNIEGDRNETSIAMQVTLSSEIGNLKALLLGDHCYPTVSRIFEISDDETVEWDILLAPHHCSKSVMYWRGDGDSDETIRQDLLDAIEDAAKNNAIVVSSSMAFRDIDGESDNPPHLIARERYEELCGAFYCTGETPDKDKPVPFRLVIGESGVLMESYDNPEREGEGKSLSAAVAAARGDDVVPSTKVGFGPHQ